MGWLHYFLAVPFADGMIAYFADPYDDGTASDCF